MGAVRKEVRHVSSTTSKIILIFTLVARGYPLKKIQENNEAEIMDVVIEEARSSYAQEIVVELRSEGTEDLESNVSRIVQWIQAWRKDRGATETN